MQINKFSFLGFYGLRIYAIILISFFVLFSPFKSYAIDTTKQGMSKEVDGTYIITNDKTPENNCKHETLGNDGTLGKTINITWRPCADMAKESAAAKEAEDKAKADAETAKRTPCDNVSGGLGGAIAGCYIVYAIVKTAMIVLGAFAAIAAKMFDLSVQNFILKIIDLFKDTTQSSNGVYSAWKMIRDLCNIAVFFGAVYIGFRRIIGVDGDEFKKVVAKLVVFAVLTNFSFPIAKFFIDISNVVSLQAYKGILGSGNMDKGVSESLLNLLGLGWLIGNFGKVDTAANNPFKGFDSFSSMMLVNLFLFFSMFVFLYGTIMIVIRAVMLLLSVVLSPLMFMGGLVPAFTNIQDWWRKNFIGNLIFGPIFIIMLLISFRLLKTGLQVIDPAVLTTANSSLPSNSLAITMSIVTLLGSVYLANRFSGSVGQFVGGMMGGVAKTAGILATGGVAGFALRGAVGRAGAAMQQSKWIQNKKENGGRFSRNTARLIDTTGKRLQSAKVFGTSYKDKLMAKKAGVNDAFGGIISNNPEYQYRLHNAKTSAQVAALNNEIQEELYSKNPNLRVSTPTTNKTVPRAGSSQQGWVNDPNKPRAAAPLTQSQVNQDLLQKNRVSKENSPAFLAAEANKKEAEMKAQEAFTKEEDYKTRKQAQKMRIEQKLDNRIETLKKKRDEEMMKLSIDEQNGQKGQELRERYDKMIKNTPNKNEELRKKTGAAFNKVTGDANQRKEQAKVARDQAVAEANKQQIELNNTSLEGKAYLAGQKVGEVKQGVVDGIMGKAESFIGKGKQVVQDGLYKTAADLFREKKAANNQTRTVPVGSSNPSTSANSSASNPTSASSATPQSKPITPNSTASSATATPSATGPVI